jgi:hypothetical protein
MISNEKSFEYKVLGLVELKKFDKGCVSIRDFRKLQTFESQNMLILNKYSLNSKL